MRSDALKPEVMVTGPLFPERVLVQYGEPEMKLAGLPEQRVEGRLRQPEERLDELNHSLENRRQELQQQRERMMGEIRRLGRTWVLPHPERRAPGIAPMVQDAEIEKIAVQFAIAHEKLPGRVVESVESENRGFDLISRKPHPADPQTGIDVRFTEVKGRAGIGEMALTFNECHAAQRLKDDYWLYVVSNCGDTRKLITIRDPTRLGWQAVTLAEHCSVRPEEIRSAAGHLGRVGAKSPIE